MEKVLNKLLFIHYIETLNKKYIIDINMLGYTTKTSDNKLDRPKCKYSMERIIVSNKKLF